ncbi:MULTISPECIES: NAD-dependent succinate-semialdehyde dehydrogenase [unclassified Oceanobacter]|jgi:succinate-semialdehyde dehydrogenase/glutarate-semialdehyde dehydrogenase|uniref:NAD-dependent succinate-semialdehyde dehydrogenase n=1 Tax=unclassified Oceanobacter TaxID=2620260 RepID=UPI0027332CE2|nr:MULTISPECIES: NAD-dependent succinate-semialdehyde dehydrogenase [unclassified Oceanobacter]MDP2548361.1 NAD-dependent succinate-semialdehyde dehydrogenase [Oceanobacter sp. 4_MG-2023]MDP2608387.1 NAD-dependent succinate-semialdehyde dehydrogenase [Oceanobacter sp. 1_MG-2023]MDP2611482.1 NAD-dependent succinate-semialdehyde dehydrogenase [Oceanobacter sp. 2_MG-2023]
MTAQLFRQQAFINGRWCDADDGQTQTIYDPANGHVIGTVPLMAEAETHAAILAAELARKGWAAMTAQQRSRILYRWYELIVAHADELARILTMEQGKPLAEAHGEILYGASFIEWFAEEGKRVYGEVIPSPNPDARIVVVKQPIGVVAAITPWNFPCAMITRKCGPALAAGCSFIVKPAPDTPFSALALAALAQQAGIPDGVFNVVTGDAIAIGNVLTSSQKVAKLSFTGSTRIGKLLLSQCADTVKKVSLELGGNAPFIVFDDADIDAAIQGAMISKFRNAGQTCVCTNRFLVQRGIHDVFVRRLQEQIEALQVGHGLLAGVDQGPLINQAALTTVQRHVRDALDKGATLHCGGEPHAAGENFFAPTLLSGMTSTMAVAQEETFGPLAAVFAFDDEDEAVALANDTDSGLAAYLYTRDMARCWRVGEALEYGMVGINEGLISTAVAPFGGIKTSGLGREGSHFGMDDYLEIKYMMMGGLGR